MQPRLLARESGDLGPREFAQAVAADLLRCFAPAPQHRFDGGAIVPASASAVDLSSSPSSSSSAAFPEHWPAAQLDRPHDLRAHGAGTASLALDKFDGRILVSGGADGSIKIWDLEACSNPNDVHTFRPDVTVPRRTADATDTETRPSSRTSAAGTLYADARGSVSVPLPAAAAAATVSTAVATAGTAPGRRTSGAQNRGHSHGITHLAFYPFDPDAFLSSSYDKTLKLWSTQRAALSAEFDLNATVYSHSASPVGQHLTVACATQHSSVRLVDLRSGSAVQGLVAHGGPVLCTAWSPRHEHLLASGHADGRARIWDVRRAGGVVAQLDQEDSLGVVHRQRHFSSSSSSSSSSLLFRSSAQAHDEAVNGLQWTDDGRYIVSAGLDRRIRVWDADRGANTLVSFGSIVQNQHAKTASFVVCPSGLFAGGTRSGSGSQVLIWPNEYEILVLDLHGGNVLSRLRSPGARNPLLVRGLGGAPRETGRNRITSIAWRGAGGGRGQVGPMMGGGGAVGAIYSGHLDGQIRAWMPAIPGQDGADEDELNEDDEAKRRKRRKRKVVDDAYRSLMGKRITFT